MILIVEDDQSFGLVIFKLIEKMSMRVIVVDSFDLADEILKNETNIELMILDFYVKNDNAMEWITRSQNNKKPLPAFVILSGQTNPEIATKLMKLGARDYISKEAKAIGDFQDRLSQIINMIETENDFMRSKELFRNTRNGLGSIMESTTDGYWELDLNDGSVYWSPKSYKIFNYTESEIDINLNKWRILIHPDDVSSFDKHINFELNDLQNNFSLEFRGLCNNGKWKWIECRGILIKSDEFVYSPKMFGTFRDISASKKLESEIDILNDQILKKLKMESLGVFASSLAHDFNNKLGTIMGYSEILLTSGLNDLSASRFIEEIYESAKQSSQMSRQLSTLIQKQEYFPVYLDINHSFSKNLVFINKILGENTELYWKFEKNLWPVLVDSSHLDQILINLCLNAKEACSKNGLIVVEINNIELTEKLTSVSTDIPEGEYVEFKISDNGRGIPPTLQNKIFEPFFTTKEVGQGNGLGLTITFNLVKQNNGYIKLVSESGKGATFSVFFPKKMSNVKIESLNEIESDNFIVKLQ